MKNISERENRDQFEGFYRMLHRLKSGEFARTQMVLIDEEVLAPPPSLAIDVLSRHMQPECSEHQPLIRHYRGTLTLVAHSENWAATAAVGSTGPIFPQSKRRTD